MDHDLASPMTSRRTLLAGAAAGVATTALLVSERAASAAPPERPTEDDVTLLVAAMRFELAAYELYKIAADRFSDEFDEFMATTFGKSHEAYAEGIASLVGVPADAFNEEIFEALAPAFETNSLRELAPTAYDVEQQAVATHTAILEQLENPNALGLTASIITAEARHAAILADAAGLGTDIDALLVNDAEPLDLLGGAE